MHAINVNLEYEGSDKENQDRSYPVIKGDSIRSDDFGETETEMTVV